MLKAALGDLRKTCVWMAFFAASFVFMYLGIVLLTKFLFLYFRGFIPDFSPYIIRAVFYPMAALSVWASFYVKKRRYSVERLKVALKKPEEIIKYLLITFIILVSLAEAPLICGFFLFFLGAMFLDFYILAAASLVMVFLCVPDVEMLEQRIKEAIKGKSTR